VVLSVLFKFLRTSYERRLANWGESISWRRPKTVPLGLLKPTLKLRQMNNGFLDGTFLRFISCTVPK